MVRFSNISEENRTIDHVQNCLPTSNGLRMWYIIIYSTSQAYRKQTIENEPDLSVPKTHPHGKYLLS